MRTQSAGRRINGLESGASRRSETEEVSMDDFVLQQVKQLFSVLNVSTALLLWLTFGSCKFYNIACA
jgi:hypothetical protein